MTPWREFGGFNIKGTPSMAAHKVLADLRVIKRRCDVFVVQEFKWPWYWTTFANALPKNAKNQWQSYAPATEGARHPIECAQVVAWKGSTYRLRGTKMLMLHDGVGGISDDRWLRASLLEDAEANPFGLSCWYGTTHFVVGGDMPGDGHVRKQMLAHDLDRLEIFLDSLLAIGWPVVFELDANIHTGTKPGDRLRQIVRSRGGEFHGNMGVEYLFTIPGKKAEVVVRNTWTIPDSELNTDHEGRCITHRITKRK